jgi:cytochrome c peroxidase
MMPTHILPALALALVLAACSDDPAGGPVDERDPALDLPVHEATGLRLDDLPPVPALPDWPDNLPSEAKQELGRALFSDNRLSGSGRTACGNCHLSVSNFHSGGPLDAPDRSFPGITPTLPRHAPSLLNLVYARMARWDGGHFTDVADLMVLPFAEANMNLSGLDVSAGDEIDVPGAQVMLKQALTVDIPGYRALFQEAFGEDISAATPERVWRLAGEAMAVYIRVAVSRDSAFDRWNAGDDLAISDAAKRGAILFVGKAQCTLCHSGPLLSDFAFHNVSTSMPDGAGVRPDEGRFLVTGLEEDRGKFLTPMLRSSAKTSPYLHDGSQISIRQVVAHLSGPAGRADPLHDRMLDLLPALSEAEIDDLVQFIKSLDGAPIPLADLRPPMVLP